MGVGSKFFSSDECRILRSSRGRGCLRGKPSRVSLRFSIKVAAGGRFAAQIESAPKRNTTRVGGVSFCLVLTKKMQGESLVLQRFLNFKLYIPVSLKSPLAHSKQTYTESLPLQQFMKNLCRFTGI